MDKKALSQGIHFWNMKALPFFFFFYKCRYNVVDKVIVIRKSMHAK